MDVRNSENQFSTTGVARSQRGNYSFHVDDEDRSSGSSWMVAPRDAVQAIPENLCLQCWWVAIRIVAALSCRSKEVVRDTKLGQIKSY